MSSREPGEAVRLAAKRGWRCRIRVQASAIAELLGQDLAVGADGQTVSRRPRPAPAWTSAERRGKLIRLVQRLLRRFVPLVLTAGFFYLVFQRIPYQRLLAALGDADYVRFLALMIPNTIIYVAWDTLVLTVAVRWFHG